MARRNRRVDTLVQQVVAELLDQEIADPRLQHVTVTGAEVTPDHKHATIFYTSLDPAVLARDPNRTGGDRLAAADEVAEALDSAAPRLQGLLARRTRLRNTPVLRFRYDQAAEEARRVDALLNEVSDDLEGETSSLDESTYRTERPDRRDPGEEPS